MHVLTVGLELPVEVSWGIFMEAGVFIVEAAIIWLASSEVNFNLMERIQCYSTD